MVPKAWGEERNQIRFICVLGVKAAKVREESKRSNGWLKRVGTRLLPVDPDHKGGKKWGRKGESREKRLGFPDRLTC